MGEPLGELTGLPLSKFATAEMIARAHRAGFSTLWEYVEHLERIRDCPWEQDFPSCVDPRHMELIDYARHADDCMLQITYRCSCGLDQIR